MNLIALLIYVVGWGLLFWVVWWGLAKIGLPEPFNKIAQVLIVLAVVIVLINLLSAFTGVSLLEVPRLR